MKRFVDLFCSFAAMFFLLPVFLVVSLAVFFSLGFPVFFKQKRIGLNEEEFELYKFRTMNFNTDSQGNLLPNKDRVTALGRLLRRSSLDEIPSLINVIRGELSIVGPRPLLPRYLPYYKKEHLARHLVKPGLTGLAQVNGRNNTSWQKRLDFDVYYVNNQSLLLDIKIALKTIVKVFSASDVEGGVDLSITPLDKDKDYQ